MLGVVAAREAEDGAAAGGPADTAGGFARVLATFASAEEVTGSAIRTEEEDSDGDGGGKRRRRRGTLSSSGSSSDGDSDSDEDASSSSSGSDDGGKPSKRSQGLTRRRRKEAARHAIAALKRVAPRPDAVEAWDATAREAPTLAQLKGARNAVAVPRHWPQKRAYLAGKRGLDKPPFKLPAFIEATGISGMRDATGGMENEGTSAASQRLKQQARARLAPKIGKLSIDYRILHAAFFRHQTKPPGLTGHGDLYYEGREYDLRMQQMQQQGGGGGDDDGGEGLDDGGDFTAFAPGRLSPALQRALGMDPTASPPPPPPWLVAQQRYGPPPSYPRLRVPGLTAPLPAGAAYGYQPGGWGKPPVDEAGRPLYGDAFGERRRKRRAERQARRARAARALAEADGGRGERAGGGEGAGAGGASEAALILLEANASDSDSDDDEPDATALVVEGSGAWAIPKGAKWGELEPEPESEEEEVEEEEEGEEGGEHGEEGGEEGEEGEGAGVGAAAVADGISSVATTVLGGVTPLPGDLDLRKGTASVVQQQQQPRQLYTVLEQRAASAAGAGTIVGSDHTYVVPSAEGGPPPSAAAPGAAAAAAAGAAAAAPSRPRAEHEKRLDALAAKNPASSASTFDVAIDPEELEGLSEEQAAALYADKASAIAAVAAASAAAAAAAAGGGAGGAAASAAEPEKRATRATRAKRAKKGDDDFKF